jgi:general secretion pathway protein J
MASTDQTFQSPKSKASKLKAIAGFTLIEVLVASTILALMALISWRGLDGMSKAQVALQTRSDANQTWQVGLAQWRTDLDNMVTLQNTPALDWDGRVLRITRQHSQDPQAGMQVVAWAPWQWAVDTRWQSAPLTQRDAWAQAWTQAQVWGESAGNPMPNNANEVLVHAIRSWQFTTTATVRGATPFQARPTPLAPTIQAAQPLCRRAFAWSLIWLRTHKSKAN